MPVWLGDRDRAGGEQAQGQHPHLATGDHHRAQGCRGRSAERADIRKRTKREVFINILEIDKPEIDAQLVAESIATQLDAPRGLSPRDAQAVESAQRFGAKGIKVRVAGRLGGSEIARSEWYLEGQLPLHTLRADVDYGFAEARTTYGIIGVKVWIYRGESRGYQRSGRRAALRSPAGDRGRTRRGQFESC